MLFKKCHPNQFKPGYISIIEGYEEHLNLLRFGLINLSSELTTLTRMSAKHEIGLVVLTGTVNIQVDDVRFEQIGYRENVFSASPATVYVPIESRYTIELVSNEASIAVCQTEATRKFEPFVMNPQDVSVAERGKGHWRRDVRDIFTANVEGKVDKLVLGETINYPGEWSGYPPHCHQVDNPPHELMFEEIYFYKLDKAEGFGVQVHYGSEFSEDKGYLVQDGDSFAIPDGFHPVVAGGGYRLYYLWFMAGNAGRTLTPYEDPNHTWIKEIPEALN